ncbi:efflux RND transporter permease subunit, partial [Omnitrophica bacterium]|nr:efflux RND transporter permease subunit [Candidatus Omnitrophota bacterium]
IVVVGSISFTRLPQELFPPITFPQVTVVTDYVNAAPEEIETLITKPIEEAVGSVAGLKRIESVSREGRSTIIVSFNWGQDIDFAALAVREKIDLIKERLPKEAEDPVVLKFDPLARPIMIISVTGKDLEPVQLKLLAEKMLKDNLEKVEGVASATVSGGLNREILIEIDQPRLQANHLSLLEIIESIENANVSYPAGSIKKGLYEYLIRTVGEFQSVREIEYAVAGVDTIEEIRRADTSFIEKGSRGPRASVDGTRSEDSSRLMDKRLVLIKDIAKVIDGTAEKTSISRYNGHENIAISIQKQANANTIKLVDNLRAQLMFLKDDLNSRGVYFDVIYDHSTFIRQSLKNLFHEAVTGGFLAFVVLYLFLRSFGASALVTLSIPVTILGVFFLMGMSHITLNIMSLGGLALAVGMIVDTSIVVLENIFRRRQLGESAFIAGERGATEVMWAVISSNLTTIAVFFPLIIFVPGILGQIIKDLSWTVIFSLIIAILIPLSLITMLSISFKIPGKGYEIPKWTGFFERSRSGSVGIERKNSFYGRLLFLIFGIIGLVLFLIVPNLEREVLPKVDQGQFLIKVDLPIGTRLEVTDRVSRKVEEVISQIEEVENVSVTIGSEKSREGEVKIETLRPYQSMILVSLAQERKRSSAEVVEEIRKKLQKVDLENAVLEFIVQESEFKFAQGGLKPILIEVKGYDFEVMEDFVKRIEKRIGQLPGVYDVLDDMAEPSPETKLNIEKRRAALYGISALDVSLIAKAAIDGVVATLYREKGREYDVRVRLSEQDRQNVGNLNNLLLYSNVLDSLIPLKEVAHIQRGEGPSEIRRVNQDRTVTISADIRSGYKQKDILEDVQHAVREFHEEASDDGFQIVLSGKARELKESFNLITFAFILSVMLVYMLMASLFESFMQPLIIMVTVPLSFVGVALILWLTGTTLNVISLLGVVVLGGIVVNNGIVLIEYTNQLREQGSELVEAAFEAAHTRTRPILMSALTTVAGLIPLALGFGEGSELRQPLAITLMGGLLSATFLTLVVVPSLYILVTRWTQRWFGEFEEEIEDRLENE